MRTLRNSRTVQTVSIDALKPYDNNPLTYPPKQLRKIEALVRRHEQIPTILVASDMTIVSGEEWWLALKSAGKTEVKVERLWQAITGRDAIHVPTGRRFDDMAQRLLNHGEDRHGA
jgi:hypothetical protein